MKPKTLFYGGLLWCIPQTNINKIRNTFKSEKCYEENKAWKGIKGVLGNLEAAVLNRGQVTLTKFESRH